MRRQTKGKSRKVVSKTIWTDHANWDVVEGKLVGNAGRPRERLFRYVGEKLPFGSLYVTGAKIRELERKVPEGIYLAHDSMGCARYGGRGRIFSRLRSHRRKYPKELVYFSFYVIENKVHERELETIILRAAGPQMTLNQRKVRSDISTGNVRDYEPGTLFFARHARRGKKKTTAKHNSK